MRLFYDSIYIARERKKKIWKIPCRTIDEYSYKVDREKQCIIISEKKIENKNSKQKGFLNRIRKFVTSLYIWDDTFRYTTMVVCTYTVAYLILFHLTGTTILLYNSQTNSYIRYIKETFQVTLHIGMFRRIFHDEISVCFFICRNQRKIISN
jgi:hypothetical protein